MLRLISASQGQQTISLTSMSTYESHTAVFDLRDDLVEMKEKSK